LYITSTKAEWLGFNPNPVCLVILKYHFQKKENFQNTKGKQNAFLFFEQNFRENEN
jgi:hypothetical protein